MINEYLQALLKDDGIGRVATQNSVTASAKVGIGAVSEFIGMDKRSMTNKNRQKTKNH